RPSSSFSVAVRLLRAGSGGAGNDVGGEALERFEASLRAGRDEIENEMADAHLPAAADRVGHLLRAPVEGALGRAAPREVGEDAKREADRRGVASRLLGEHLDAGPLAGNLRAVCEGGMEDLTEANDAG